MRKLRILHCLETVGSGGVEQTRLTLARGLDRTRYEQALVCTQAIGALPPLFDATGCVIHQVGVFRGIYDPLPYRHTLGIVQQYRPDIIHGGVYEGVALAAVCGRLGRVPVIIGEETSDPVDRRWKGQLLFRLLSAMTHQMVAVSPAVKNYLTNTLRLPAAKVTLINNGVTQPASPDPAELRAIRDRFNLRSDHFVIGTVGRLLDRHKRVSDLIRALPLIKKYCPNVRLLIVGSGPDEDMLHRLAAELGVTDDVCFAGYQGDPTAYYEVMDVFALASAFEAFGLVLVEAMFAHLPVVATRVGGIPTVVSDGETGILVAPLQPETLADALITLWRNEGLRMDMGRKGRIRALAEFSAERYLREIENLYQSLAKSYLVQ